MSQAGGEPDIAALQGEIVGTASATKRIREWWCSPAANERRPILLRAWCLAWIAMFLTTILGFSVRTALTVVCGVLFIATIALPLGTWGASVLYRWRRRELLRRQLAQLPPKQAAKVILRFENHPDSDPRSLIDPLLRELRTNATELTPAASPEGRGDGASPAERTEP